MECLLNVSGTVLGNAIFPQTNKSLVLRSFESPREHRDMIHIIEV